MLKVRIFHSRIISRIHPSYQTKNFFWAVLTSAHTILCTSYGTTAGRFYVQNSFLKKIHFCDWSPTFSEKWPNWRKNLICSNMKQRKDIRKLSKRYLTESFSKCWISQTQILMIPKMTVYFQNNRSINLCFSSESHRYLWKWLTLEKCQKTF